MSKMLVDMYCSKCEDRTRWIRVRHGSWFKWVCGVCGVDHDDNYNIAKAKDELHESRS
jgi:hypothetical protein